LNKKGWIKIVEAFVAILLIMGALIITIGKTNEGKEDVEKKVYEAQIILLHQILLNSEDKSQVLAGGSEAEEMIQYKIDTRKPKYLVECKVRICDVEEECELASENSPTGKDVFVQHIITEDTTHSKKLKLFCWV